MADSISESSSTAANQPETKGRRKFKRLLPSWLKRSKLANPGFASQPNSAEVSIFSAPGAHNPDAGNDAESPEPASSYPATLLRSASSSAADLPLPISTVGRMVTKTYRHPGFSLGRGGHSGEANSISTPTAQPASTNPTNPQTQALDRMAIAKEGLGVASRFVQTLLKRMPECVDSNPVKMAFSIARVIIEITDAVGDNKDGLVYLLEETANRLMGVKTTTVNGVPEAANQAMEEFKQILGKEMEELQVLSSKWLATQVLDHENYKNKIQQIFKRVEGATTSFQLKMTISIQNTTTNIQNTTTSVQNTTNDIQNTTIRLQDDNKKAALQRLRPSSKADHKTLLEDQALKREECTPGTRVKILDDISKWANDSSPASARVFWLTGQAGSGKTTIAYTIAKLFENDDNADQQTVLGANFLCSRQFEETRQRIRIIPTLAYQLARKCESYADALYAADKFEVVNHDVSKQLKHLFVRPWQQSDATRDQGLPPYLIVIDALDEIDGEGGSEFLRDLLTAIDEYHLKGFKFLVTSRSHPEIVTLYQRFTSGAVLWLQDVPIEEANLDIDAYLKTKLPKLAGNPQLVELGRRTGGLFIYAATAVKYLTPSRSVTSREQGKMLNELLFNSYRSTPASKATFLIDELYRQIMHDTFSKYEGEILTDRLRILYTFLCTAERTSPSIVAALVVEGDDDATRAVAEDLHAVLYIQNNRVFWYHASFPDFVFDRARSNFHRGGDKFDFSCYEPAHHNLLGESCFRIMSGLRFNMGDIPSSFLFDSDNADELLEKVNTNISAVLSYSSRHWTQHLPSPLLVDPENLRRRISDFLQIRVLFWIEAMNLLGSSNQCTPMLQYTRQWVLKCGDSCLELASEVGEAANFATYFTGSPATQSTPHLYISALATWSSDTSLCRKWKKQFTQIPVFTHTKGSIDLPLMTIPTGRQTMAVAFSSDGTRIVSGSGYDDYSVRVWDASTGAELNMLEGHTEEVKWVAFLSGDMRIVSGSDDGSVRIWDASTGEELCMLDGHIGGVHSITFSSDKMQIASRSDKNSVLVWDASTGVELQVLKGHTDYVFSVAFSRDSTRIVSGSGDESVRVWDASTGVELKILNGHTNAVYSVAFSTDGKQIVSGSVDNSVRVWDASTGAQLNVLNGHTDRVFSVAFSSNGTRIVSGSADHSVRVWDASTGVELNMLNGHTGCVNSVAFSSDSTRIVSGSNDHSVRVWNASTGADLKGHLSMGNSVTVSSEDRQTVFRSYDRSVLAREGNISTAAELKMPQGHTGGVRSVAISSNNLRIVSGSNDNSVRVWDGSTGAELNVLKGHTSNVVSVALSSDNRRIVSGSHDNSVRVWDASTGALLDILNGHTDYVNSVAFSNDGTRIVSGSDDQSVRVWDVSTGAQLNILDGHASWVSSVAFSSNGMWIVSGSGDESVRVWNATTGAELSVLEGHTGWVTSVAFSNDGTRIVSGSSGYGDSTDADEDDYSVWVWDVSTGKELVILNGHTDWVRSVAFSSDDRWIVSGSMDRSIRMWDASTGAKLRIFNGHNGSVNSVAFSNDSTRIVSGSADESVQVWDISTGLGVNMPNGYTSSVNSVALRSDDHSFWNLTETNWIISSLDQDRLMWVPQEARIAEPSNILVISRYGFGSIDFRESMIGSKWVGCYTPYT